MAKALGQLPSGIVIVSANVAGQDHYLLASWVQQVGFTPPLLTIALAKDRPLLDLLAKDQKLVLHILGDDQKSISGLFLKKLPEGESAFDQVEHVRNEDGTACITGAHASLRAVVVSRVDLELGDHSLLVVQALEGEIREGEEHRPWIHIRKNGLSY